MKTGHAVAGAILAATICVLVVVVTHDENRDALVLESVDNKVLEEKRDAAESKLNDLSKIKKIVQRAMKNPTPENIKAAMAAQQELHASKAAAAPSSELDQPAEPVAKARAITTPKEAANMDMHQLTEKKKSDESRVEKLNSLKAIIHKAVANPSPENMDAAMAAQKQLAGLMAMPAAPEAQTSAKDEQQPNDNSLLEKRKQADESRVDKLNSLKAIIHKAVKNPSSENMEAAMAAQKQLSGLMAKPASGGEDTKMQKPVLEQQTASKATEEAHVESTTPSEKQNPEKEKASAIHGASADQFAKLKALVKTAMKNPTQENTMAVAKMEAEMRNTKGQYKKPTVHALMKDPKTRKHMKKMKKKLKKSPVLFNLDIDNLGSIPVRAGDAAATLAKDFAAKHHLSDSMASKLEQMVAQQMSLHHIKSG